MPTKKTKTTRPVQAAKPKPRSERPTGKVDRKIYGASGTSSYNGFITEDFNSEFHGQGAVRIFDRMRKTDGTVSALLKALKLPLMGAEYGIEPVDPKDPEEVEIAEMVKSALFERMNFNSFMREALGMLDFGFYYFEKVWGIEDGMVVLKKLAPRLPSAHYRWEMEGGEPGVSQQLPTWGSNGAETSGNPSIPLDKLVIFTNDMEGENWEGQSVLRSAYKHWFHKDTLYRIDGIKHERGAGILIITTPDSGNDDDYDQAEELGERFKISESAYIVKPGKEWEVELLTNGIKEQSGALIDSVRHHDRMMLTAILAQFLDLGSAEVGSRALSEDQSSFFQLSLKAIGKSFRSTVNRSVIEDIVNKNYGLRKKYPKFKFNRIGEFDEKQTAEWLQILSDSGYVRPDDEVKSWVRQEFQLPEYVKGQEEQDKEPDEDEQPKKKDEKSDWKRSVKQCGVGDGDVELSQRRRRPLFFAERRVELDGIEKFFNDSQAAIEAELAPLSAAQKKRALDEAERIIRSRDVAAIESFESRSGTKANDAAKAAAKSALERGKKTAAAEIGVSIPVTSKLAKRLLDARIAAYIVRRDRDLSDVVRSRLLSIVDKDVGTAAALFDLEKLIDANIRRTNGGLSSLVAMNTFSTGRNMTFRDARDQLHGLQRSEILDRKTCPMCISLDGRTVKPTDPFAQMEQVHAHCRGMWVGVLKTDMERPEPKELPKAIRDRFDTVGGVPVANDFRQPKRPVAIRKDSRAARKIKDGDLDV